MKNFDELQKLIREKREIDEYIERIKSIEFCQGSTSIGLKENSNGRYTFEGISKIIGEEKMQLLVEQFECLITNELLKKKSAKESELSKYEIVLTAP